MKVKVDLQRTLSLHPVCSLDKHDNSFVHTERAWHAVKGKQKCSTHVIISSFQTSS